MMLGVPRDVLAKLRENMHEYGLSQTLERSGVWGAKRLLASTVHRHSRPPLSAFEGVAASVHFSAENLVGTYLPLENRDSALALISSEYERLCMKIDRRYVECRLAYPQRYAVEQGSAYLLYALVRSLRPSVVLETGVANGHSSFFILNAMEANGHGILHSVDRSAEVGGLLTDQDRERWRLHVLKATDLKRSFSEILAALPLVNLFLHDSDHTYPWQSFELNAALKKLAPGAVLAADDCDSSYAFLDACQKINARPVILLETRKVFGLIFSEQPLESCSRSSGERCRLVRDVHAARL